MAGPIARLYATLGLDTTGFDKGVKTTQQKAKGLGSQVGSGIGAGLGIGVGLGVAGVAAMGASAIVDGFGDAIDAASDFEEANSKVGVVFETMADDVREFASGAATSMGMSEDAALSALGTFGNFTQALGVSEQASADMSKAMVQLAADIGSFNNVAADEVLLALRSGLSGEAEPMRRFGVALSEAAVSEHLLAKGIERTNGRFTEAQKVQARYELILEKTTKAQGDFARTADSLANKQKTLDANIRNLQVSLGQVLLPVVADATDLFADFAAKLAGPSSAAASLDAFIDRQVAARDATLATGEAVAAAAEEWKSGLGTIEDVWADTILGEINPGMKEHVLLWREHGEVIAKSGIGFQEWRRRFDRAKNELGLSNELALANTISWAKFGKEVETTITLLEGLPKTAATGIMSQLDLADPAVAAWQREYEARLSAMRETALRTGGDIDSPFADLFAEDAETIEEDFSDIRAEIRAGFGSVKDALKKGSGEGRIVDPATRMRNMQSRLTEASSRLRQAVEAGDPFAISYWEAAVDKQRVQLQGYRRQTLEAQDRLAGDMRDRTGAFARAGRAQGRAQGRAYREALAQTMTNAVENVIQSVGQALANSIININGNVYGGPAGTRQLAADIDKATRPTRRDRRP